MDHFKWLCGRGSREAMVPPEQKLSNDFHACRKFLSAYCRKLIKVPFINQFLLQSILD